jgi:hypothetical protein
MELYKYKCTVWAEYAVDTVQLLLNVVTTGVFLVMVMMK